MRIKYQVLTIGIVVSLAASVMGFTAEAPSPAQTASSTALDYFTQGNLFYSRSDFKRAIDPYSKALELEKKQSTLSKTFWYVLVDNLGMSYGITGDLKKAKETFEYGLTRDSKYPLFYYNLACTYAELNDLDQTISFLKRAFEYKANVIPGEMIPDPAKDDSFQRFIRNDKFLAALKELR